MASNETRWYHYSFDIHESPWEHEKWGIFTVKLRLWKLDERLADRTVAVEVGRRECDIHRDEVNYNNDEEPTTKLSTCLTELGVPKVCHATMITRLMRCIDLYVIRRHHYRHQVVLMDIVGTFDVGVLLVDTIRLSIETSEMRHPRRWWLAAVTQFVQVPMEQDVDDDLEEAVANQSLEEYTAHMQVPASEGAISTLEKVQQSDVECEKLSCKICMDDKDNKLGFSRMPCRHVFHTVCVETWLRISYYCPLCRYALPD